MAFIQITTLKKAGKAMNFTYKKGMGIGGWLTNYKRFNVLPMDKRLELTIGDYEHFDTYITEWDVVNIKNMGMDHIRLGFDQIVLETEPYVYNDHTFGLVEGFVGWCQKHGLGVVLNLHKCIGNYCDIEESVTLFDSTELQDRFIALWLELERRFADNENVMFELLNEVRDIEPRLWNDLAEKTINAIRRVNKTRKIIIGTTNWNNPNKLHALKVFDDENVIYTFHVYDPSEFTHQRGVLHWCQLYYNRKMEYPGDIEKYREYYRVLFNNHNAYSHVDVMDINYMREIFEPVKKFRSEHPDKTLWCGEFGTIRHADLTSRENWMRDVITLLKECDVPYSVWNYLSTPNDGNRFSLVDDDTRKILSPEMLKIINGEV
ncbi:MAG: cellulase family glycosylhydrolase [Clostridia bacterium]|nr:cellulase family glycosylhydrolase [Clostridia bacterium]